MSSIYRQCTSKFWAVQEKVQKMKTPNWNINSWVIAFVRWSFFFLYGLVRVFPISLFRKIAGPFLHLFIHFSIPRKRVIRKFSGAFDRSCSAATKDRLG